MKSIFKNHYEVKILLFGLVFLLLCALGWAQEDELYKDGYLKPSELVQDFMNRDGNTDTLNNMSPDGIHFMIPVSDYFSSLKLMTQRTLRLGMLEICPDVNRSWRSSTYGNIGIKIYSLEQKKSWMIQVPDNAFVSDMVWSPDGKKIAFLAHLPQGTQVWTGDVKSGKAQAFNKSFVMATLTGGGGFGRGTRPPSQMLQWTSSGSIITVLVPPGRGPEPKDNPVPSTPLIRHTRKKPASTSTYPFLLRTKHDKNLLEYYTTSQLAELTQGKKPPQGRLLRRPRRWRKFRFAQGYFLASGWERPFIAPAGTHITAFDLDQTPPQKLFLLKKIETQNPVKLPGSIMVRMNGNGIRYALTSEGNKHIFLQSQGYQEDFKPRPFIDSIEILNGKKERVFEGSSDIFERLLTPLDSPLLMYHGAADNNTGTFLIQSERYIQLLTGLGKNAVLYIYPFESHGPRCKETYMDMWSRWLGFFDKYVKGEQTESEK